MLLFWIVFFVASLAIPWFLTSYMAGFFRKSVKDEFRGAFRNKLMELLGLLVALIWVAVLAGILVERYIIHKGG